MAVAFSRPAVAQEDYRCMRLQEDLLLCLVLFFWGWLFQRSGTFLASAEF